MNKKELKRLIARADNKIANAESAVDRLQLILFELSQTVISLSAALVQAEKN